MRVMGLDVGERRIGVAISDEAATIASPLTFVDAGNERAVAAIGALCGQHGVSEVVVGLPLSLAGGDRGLSSRRARALGAALEAKLGVTVHFRDERFTTTIAERALKSGQVRRRERRDKVDKVAAAIILQGFLDEREDL